VLITSIKVEENNDEQMPMVKNEIEVGKVDSSVF